MDYGYDVSKYGYPDHGSGPGGSQEGYNNKEYINDPVAEKELLKKLKKYREDREQGTLEDTSRWAGLGPDSVQMADFFYDDNYKPISLGKFFDEIYSNK